MVVTGTGKEGKSCEVRLAETIKAKKFHQYFSKCCNRD